MKYVASLFAIQLTFSVAFSLKIVCNRMLNNNNNTSFGNLKTCVSEKDIVTATPNTTVDGVECKEDPKKIKGLWLKECPSMQYLPAGIPKFFPNLKILYISFCGLRALTKEDLKPFAKLQGLYVVHTNLTSLEGDVFKYATKLEELSISTNHIRYVQPGTFKPLSKLVRFLFYDLCYQQPQNFEVADEFDSHIERIEESCNDRENDNSTLKRVKLKCEYVRNNNRTEFGQLAECEVNRDINVANHNVWIESVECSESASSIKSLVIGYAKDLHFLPHGLAEKFPALQLLMIGDSGLRDLSSVDLLPLSKLKGLYLINTELTFLEFNLFMYSRELNQLVIKGHKLKFIEYGIFEQANKLTMLVFKDNQCFDKSYIRDKTGIFDYRRKEIYLRCMLHEEELHAIKLRRKKVT